MRTILFNCASYLPWSRRPANTLVVVVLVVILTGAFTAGYGEAAIVALGTAVLSAVATEGVKAALRVRPRNA
jgi:hypothetical protein